MKKILFLCIILFIVTGCEERHTYTGKHKTNNESKNDTFDSRNLPNGLVIAGTAYYSGRCTLTFLVDTKTITVDVPKDVYNFIQLKDVIENGKIKRDGVFLN